MNCFKEKRAENSLLVPGEHANNSCRNALCKFNSFRYIWFPLFKLTLFNHTEAGSLEKRHSWNSKLS